MSKVAELQARWRAYTVSKTALIWSCAGCVVATLVFGFTWGGWVTGSTANRMAQFAAEEARIELAAAICVDRFLKGPDSQAKYAALKSTSYWSRGDFIEDGGWAALPGLKEPVEGAASECAERLMETKAAGDAKTQSG